VADMQDMWVYNGLGGSAQMACPCPADLVPHDRLHDVAASIAAAFERRTVEKTRRLLDQANSAPTVAARDHLLRPQSIAFAARESPFLDGTAGVRFDVFNQHGVDVLHQLLEGVFPVVFTAVVQLVKATGGTAALKTIDARFTSVPTHPRLSSLGSDGAVDRTKYTADIYFTIMVVRWPQSV
jgi:hypothetical protein